jgi:hypothetical protein
MWDRFRQRYAWHPVFENMPMPKELAPIEFYNGEIDYILFPQTNSELDALRAAPSELTYWTVSGTAGHRRWYEVHFDEEETLTAFERIGGDQKPFELVFRQGDAQTGNSVWVRRGAEAIRLWKAKMD